MLDDLSLALRLCRDSDALSSAHAPRRDSRPNWWLKDDGSMVTDVDINIERVMREALSLARPSDCVWGEELPPTDRRSPRRWLVDPIDGTQAYLEGGTRWGTHLTLLQDQAPVVAVMTRPALGRTFFAVRDGGAFTRDAASTVSLRLAEPQTPPGPIGHLVEPSSVLRPALAATLADRLVESADPLVELLDGDLAAVVDEGGEPWDVAPAALLCVEAGGIHLDGTGGTNLDTGLAVYGRAADARLLETIAAGAREGR